MRVLFVLPRMASGGVERATLDLIEELTKVDHLCALALRQACGGFLDEARSLVDVHEVAPYGMHQFVPGLAKLLKRWQPTNVVTAFPDVAVLTWTATRPAHGRSQAAGKGGAGARDC